MRILYTIILLACVTACSHSLSVPALVAVFEPDAPLKPNILVIMVDDLGYNDLAINNNNTEIHTPNMDQLAQEGVRFTRHYASQVCSPARAAFLTGVYPERLGYLPNGRGISPEVETLPELLQREGYVTWHIGKWHVGDLDRIAWPDHQGFDHWFGFLNQWRLAGVHKDGKLKMTRPRYENPWLEGDSDAGQHYVGHLENILTEKAIEVLDTVAQAQVPWFINLWYYAPHGPVSPASEFAARYPDTPDGKYRALVHQLDFNIGRVIAHLEVLDVLKNTIIVVVSDNGGAKGRLASNDNNAPFAGFKTSLTEGGLRAPLIVRWPGESLSGQVFSEAISIRDIYPTLMESIDITPPDNIDGVSFYKSIQQLNSAPQRALYWKKGLNSYGVLSADGAWRLNQLPPLWGLELDPLLYDLNMHPSGAIETVPLPPTQYAQMEASYQSWYRDVHTVQMDYLQSGASNGVLKGMDLLRTPGFGPYTFGIGIADDFYGQVAAQQDIWELSRSGNTVMARFGDMVLSGEIESVQSCHSIVVSGSFGRQASNRSPPDTINLTLYIDGQEVQTATLETTLIVDDPTIETTIGDPDFPANGAIFLPVILNTSLSSSSAWTVESFSEDICAF